MAIFFSGSWVWKENTVRDKEHTPRKAEIKLGEFFLNNICRRLVSVFLLWAAKYGKEEWFLNLFPIFEILDWFRRQKKMGGHMQSDF